VGRAVLPEGIIANRGLGQVARISPRADRASGDRGSARSRCRWSAARIDARSRWRRGGHPSSGSPPLQRRVEGSRRCPDAGVLAPRSGRPADSATNGHDGVLAPGRAAGRGVDEKIDVGEDHRPANGTRQGDRPFQSQAPDTAQGDQASDSSRLLNLGPPGFTRIGGKDRSGGRSGQG
jgi:hypothetical protein